MNFAKFLIERCQTDKLDSVLAVLDYKDIVVIDKEQSILKWLCIWSSYG